jgi:hypothetical protein
MGPIPIVSLSNTGEVPFAGPRLEERLRFSDTDEEETFHELFDNFWQDDAVDQIPRVMSELEENGEIPGVPASDRWGPPILTADHHKKVQRRLRNLRLPDIDCYLSETWGFPVIETDARRRLGHINPNVSIGFGNRLLSAALDLQAAFCSVHPRHTAADTFWFWTSLQVHKHLAEFCKKRLWDQRQHNDSMVESARRRFSRALGSYAYEACPSGGAAHTLKSGVDIASNCDTAAKEDLVPSQDSPGAHPSIDDLVAHAQARFMKWHQKLRKNRDDRLRELHRLNLGAAGRAVHRFTIYEELLTREVKRRIKIRKAVADKYNAVELLSKAQLDVFREVIMTSVTWACAALRDHNEMDFRAVGERGPFPETNRYEGLKGRILSVVNTELEVLETEGRLLALSSSVQPAKAPTVDASAGQGQALKQGDQTHKSESPSLADPDDAGQSSGGLSLESRPKRNRGRPAKIPDELKKRALAVKGGKARAQILYKTKYPSPQQVKNVHSILRHYNKKHKPNQG